jgi:hypothetical protein
VLEDRGHEFAPVCPVPGTIVGHFSAARDRVRPARGHRPGPARPRPPVSAATASGGLVPGPGVRAGLLAGRAHQAPDGATHHRMAPRPTTAIWRPPPPSPRPPLHWSLPGNAAPRRIEPAALAGSARSRVCACAQIAVPACPVTATARDPLVRVRSGCPSQPAEVPLDGAGDMAGVRFCQVADFVLAGASQQGVAPWHDHRDGHGCHIVAHRGAALPHPSPSPPAGALPHLAHLSLGTHISHQQRNHARGYGHGQAANGGVTSRCSRTPSAA